MFSIYTACLLKQLVPMRSSNEVLIPAVAASGLSEAGWQRGAPTGLLWGGCRGRGLYLEAF